MKDGNKQCITHCVNSCEAYGLVCPCSARVAADAAGNAAAQHLRKSRKVSILFGDLELGERLGQGGYCDVNQVKFQERECAIKRLRKQIMVNGSTFESGAADLATEAGLLTKLSHRNIVKVHGVAAGPVPDSITSEEGFFIVMEKLEKTLDDQILNWKQTKLNRRNRLSHLLKRLDVALQIASGVQYLHTKDIVHRDLKPANIGFDKDGSVKLFDFGIAQQVRGGESLNDATGSARYMAPEMVLHKPYNNSVDVYALGLIVWQICALDTPFQGYNRKQHERKVAMGGERPKVAGWWPKGLQGLIKTCWSESQSQRPHIDSVVQSLRALVSAKRK